jgi:thioredoxin reductase (NADPH)
MLGGPVLSYLQSLLQAGALSIGRRRGSLEADFISKPTILTVDDDPMVSAAISRDLRSRYGADYLVVGARSVAQALAVLTKLALRNQPVALIASDQRMPGMTGVEMLEQARTHALGAKFLLLTAYADTDVAIKAINAIGLDYYEGYSGVRVEM